MSRPPEWREVRQAVAALPPGQRGVVVGFYLAGLTYQEAVDALGIGVPAVKTRLHNGRARPAKQAPITLGGSDRRHEGDVVEMRIANVRSGAYNPEAATAALRGGIIVLLDEVRAIAGF
jgi:hypothetical protein